MPEPGGFLGTPRRTAPRRPVDVRIQDWREIDLSLDQVDVEQQAGRCMDCGIAFCHGGCPLGNLIPEWNDLVSRQRWREAAERLHATNNFPEFTGRLCPAPCETACVLGIDTDPVAIKQVEVDIIDRAWAEGWVTAQLPARNTQLPAGNTRLPAPSGLAGQPVAVIGSGPAGLAAAQQLARAGHVVTVFEQADQPGGLLRYGIPEFKLEKWRLDRRLAQLRDEGIRFECGAQAGGDVTPDELRAAFRAMILACGARVPRELTVPGADLSGIHQAMEYLTLANRAVTANGAEGVGRAGSGEPAISARGKHVVIIGGGDTGADCLGVALRQGAASVTQLEILGRPPRSRPDHQPWPTYPMIYRVSGAHEEGGERAYAVATREFVAGKHGRVGSLRLVEVVSEGGQFIPRPDTERELACDLALLAMGFRSAEDGPLLAGLGLRLDERGVVPRDDSFATAIPGVFVAGDMGRGQSLIVWAIAEGRSAAASADRYLSGWTSLPSTIPASARPLAVRF